MPIYELYCADCHTLFDFFSSRVDTETTPGCPRCRGSLVRKPAVFATLSRRARPADGEGGEAEILAGLDEERLEGALESVMAEAETTGENEDPRQMARLLRRFGEAAGLEPGGRMEEILARLEAGEDPDQLEEEMGADLDGEEADLTDLFRRKRAAARAARRPRKDPELHFF